MGSLGLFLKKIDESLEDNSQDSIKLRYLSVRLIHLSESQLEKYLKVNQEPINKKSMSQNLLVSIVKDVIRLLVVYKL